MKTCQNTMLVAQGECTFYLWHMLKDIIPEQSMNYTTFSYHTLKLHLVEMTINQLAIAPYAKIRERLHYLPN